MARKNPSSALDVQAAPCSKKAPRKASLRAYGKTSHSSTLDSSESNSVYKYDYYLDMFSLRERPVSDRWLDNLAVELIKWAINNSEALKLTQFYQERGIGSNDVKRWIGRNENFARAHSFARGIIGDRREIGAIKRIYDPSMIRAMQAYYDEDYKVQEEWRIKTRNADPQGPAVIRVLVPVIESEDVPSRALENEDSE